MLLLKEAIKIGLFIGVTTSLVILAIMRITQPNKLVFIFMLYSYVIVGLLTSIILYLKLNKKSKKRISIKNNLKKSSWI